MEFTILMPCLNEEKTVKYCIEEAKEGIRKSGIEAEILIVDNASTDETIRIALEAGARVVTAEERGYGAALREGIRNACGTYIIMGDADGSYDFGNLEPFVEGLRKGADLVVGDRFRGGIQKGAMPLLHRVGVPFLSAVARWRFGTTVRDFHCGIRAFDREKALALDMKCTGMEFATEMIAAFAVKKFKIAEVPVILRKDLRDGKSHIRTFRDGFRHLRFILYKKE